MYDVFKSYISIFCLANLQAKRTRVRQLAAWKPNSETKAELIKNFAVFLKLYFMNLLNKFWRVLKKILLPKKNCCK